MKKIVVSCLLALSVSQANELELDVQAFLNVALGSSSVSEEELATHAHDPNQNFSLQGFELDFNARWNEQLRLNFRTNSFLSLEDELESEVEEAFIEWVGLPLGAELKAGRFLPLLGNINHVHVHGWDFVNQTLINTQFLGEEGLLLDGAQLSTKTQLGGSSFGLSLAYGSVVEHDHGHEEEGDDHGHGAENANFNANSGVFSAQLAWDYAYSDAHQYQWLVSGAFGENGYRDDRDSWLLASDIKYSYDSNGYEDGGKKIELLGSWYYREVEWAHEEDDDPFGSSGHIGLGAGINYSWNPAWKASARVDYIEGLSEGYVAAEDEFGVEIDERTRYSLALTRYLNFSNDQAGLIRLQGDVDELASGEQEQSVWLQFGWSWAN